LYSKIISKLYFYKKNRNIVICKQNSNEKLLLIPIFYKNITKNYSILWNFQKKFSKSYCSKTSG
jgi:hypothetical protein